MDRYKINLSYYNDATLISSHDVVDTIVNAEDLELTLARQLDYEGLFLEISDTFQFIGVDKDYILSVYEDWKTRLSANFKLEITVNILETSTLIYEEAYKGLCDWDQIGIEENVVELIFIEESNTFTLLQKDKVSFDIDVVEEEKNISFNGARQYNSDHVIRYGGGSQNVVADTFEQVKVIPIDLSFDNEENQFVNGTVDTVISTIEIDQFFVDVDFKIDLKTDVEIVLPISLNPLDVFLDIRVKDTNLSTGSYGYTTIISDTKEDVITPTAVFVLDTTTTLSSVILRPEFAYTLEIKAIVEESGVPVGFTYDINYLLRIGEPYNIGFYADKILADFDIKTVRVSNVFDEFNTILGLSIDNSVMTSNQINDLHFTTSKGLLNSDVLFGQSYEAFFKGIKKTGFLGLQLTDAGLVLSSLDTIYNKNSTIIDLGIANSLTSNLNENITFGNLLLGSGSKDEDEDLQGYTKFCNYFNNSGIKTEKDLQVTEWAVDSAQINEKMLDLFQDDLKEGNDVIGIFTELANPIVTPTTPVLSGYNGGTSLNAEYGAYKRLQTWRNWLITAFDGVESLEFASGDVNKDVSIQDNTDNITVDLTSDTYSKASTPFGGLENKIFGIDKYVIGVPITPYLYKTIKANPNNRYKVNYKGLDYIFFLRNININLLNDSVATIKGWESFNKI